MQPPAAEILDTTFSLQFYLGECPVYFEEPCNTNIVKFILSVGGNNHSNHHLDPHRPLLPQGYNVLNPLKIVIHGYGGLEIDSASRNVTQAYQDIGYNVISVDWGPLALLPCYLAAYLNAWHVGRCLSILVIRLMALGVEPQFTHVIGFSLGAHIAGFAGMNLKNSIGYSFMRITEFKYNTCMIQQQASLCRHVIRLISGAR
nr:phospholipase A1 member A-like [Leptinotarsa decemlineata]